jgi:hypothetical protein
MEKKKKTYYEMQIGIPTIYYTEYSETPLRKFCKFQENPFLKQEIS